MRTRCEIKNGSVRMESARRSELHIGQRFFALAILQFGDGAQIAKPERMILAPPDAAA